MISFVRLTRSLLSAAGLVLAACSAAPAAEPIVLVVARCLPAEPAKAALAEVLRLALEKAEPGTRFIAIDSVSREIRADFAVPAGTARLRANTAPVREGLAAVRRAFLESPARAPWEAGALCLPQVLAHLRAQALAPGGSAVVVFFGDPLHRAPEEAFDWRGGAVPTTGWILGDADSPFSARRLGSLKGLRVHVAAIPVGWGVDDWQRNGAREFLGAMLAEAAGKLVTLADTKLAIARAMQGVAEALPFPAIDRDDTARLYRRKIFVRGQEQEIRVRVANEKTAVMETPRAPAPASVALEQAPVPVPTPAVSVPAPALEPVVVAPTLPPAVQPTPQPAPLPLVPSEEAQQLAAKAESALPAVGGLGLVWEVVGGDPVAGRKADLDLFVSVRGVAGECWWKQMKLPEKNPVVRLHDDVRNARGLGATGEDRQVFEFVEFSRRDREFRAEDLTVWVNIHEHAGTGKIRALFRLQTADGKKFDYVFELPAVRGNQGAGDRAITPQWKRIDVAQVMAEAATTASVSAAGTVAR